MADDFYVYLISRPNGVPCYVGKGSNKRWKKHAWRSTNPHLANIYAQNGRVLPIEKIAENLSEDEAFALEKRLIASYGREPNGPLVNMTDGGEGPSGLKLPAETLARIALVHVGNKYRLGMKASAETKALQSALKLGRKQSPEHIEARAAPLRGRKRPPEVGAKVSASKTGKSPRKYNWSPEARAGQKERFRDPAILARIRVGMITGRWRRECPVFVSEFANWGDGASAGILSCV